jgi:predicted NACHT family NTPase
LYNELIHDNTDDESVKDFLLRTLKNGQLVLLLNGLDEVKIDPTKTKNLIDLLKKDSYKKCRVIFTCRLEAWEQFKELFFCYQQIEIKSFDDSQIHQFLSNSWQMPKGKLVAEFMGLLNNFPKIKILAQNPLLLTGVTSI